MPEPYSLAGRAWLPVALQDGRRVFVRPCDIPDADLQILRLATGRADCDISLTELLIGLLAVACPPASRRDWHRQFLNPPSPGQLQAAFALFDAALVLDGDGPRFFQDIELLEGEANEIAALFIDAPGGNTVKENADHFVKRGRTDVLSRAGAAIALATLQTSAPSGGAGHRTSLRGGGPLTTIVFPGAAHGAEPSLWQKLWTNVPTAEDGEAPSVEEAPGIFPWLRKTRISDKGAITTPADVHPAQAFFGMPRRIRLNFEANADHKPCDLLGIVDDIIVTSYVTRPWGVNYTAWSRAHPLSPYYRQKETETEYLPLHSKSSRVGYRQWLGMVMETTGGLRVPAKCLDTFRLRAMDFRDSNSEVIRNARLLVAGYAMDNMKPLDFAEALLPLIVTGDPASDVQLRDIASAWINAADEVANQLVSAVKRALYGETNDKVKRDSTVLDAVQSRFWADSEGDFYDHLQAVTDRLVAQRQPDDLGTLKQSGSANWLQAIKRHAFGIFDDTAPIEDADGDRIEDVIAGRKMLRLMLSGYGKGGGKLFDGLGQLKPETRKVRGKE